MRFHVQSWANTKVLDRYGSEKSLMDLIWEAWCDEAVLGQFYDRKWFMKLADRVTREHGYPQSPKTLYDRTSAALLHFSQPDAGDLERKGRLFGWSSVEPVERK